MSLLLGIDLGTSSAKAVLFDPNTSQILATAGREYSIHKPAPDRAEQNADDWWTATAECTRQVVAQAGRNDIAGIGFSGQMHGGALLDSALHPIQPAIIWADQRSAREVRDIIDTVGEAEHARIAGTLPAAGFMGPTLLWLSRHQPDVLAQVFRVVLPKDYVRLKMTGEVATDVSDAAGTGLFDVTQRQWSAALLERLGLPQSIFPPVLGSSERAGQLTADAAEALGLDAGIPVVAGCSDQPAQALANGLVDPGAASVTTGSGGQVFTPLHPQGGAVPTDARLHVFNHCIPDRWYILGAILAAGLNLRWLRGILGMEGDPDAYARLSAEAAHVPPGADGLIYLPYLYGERTPHMDALARGGFIGLGGHHTRGHLARAVMEGVAFALRQCLDLSSQLGGGVDLVVASGGGAESDVWRQIQADVFGIPLRRTLHKEQAGLGAALLAGIGVGVYADHTDAVRRVAQYGAVTEPDLVCHAFYDEIYAQYADLYPTLRADFHLLSTRRAL